jgi:type II restriction enzyme
MTPLITPATIARRAYWVEEIKRPSGRFGDDSDRLQTELNAEIAKDGLVALLDHLRLCGVIPEVYRRDSSEEKLYSKYTDAVLSLAFSAIGLKSHVVRGRADSADVEAVAKDFSLVAEARPSSADFFFNQSSSTLS